MPPARKLVQACGLAVALALLLALIATQLHGTPAVHRPTANVPLNGTSPMQVGPTTLHARLLATWPVVVSG